MFGSLGALWGRCGLTFCIKNQLGAPKVAQEAFAPKSPHPFGDLLEVFFLNISVVFAKKSGSEIGGVFFFNFLITLSAPRDGLTCNPYAPAQSRRTFPFSHFF